MVTVPSTRAARNFVLPPSRGSKTVGEHARHMTTYALQSLDKFRTRVEHQQEESHYFGAMVEVFQEFFPCVSLIVLR